jgi:hypothetical protein
MPDLMMKLCREHDEDPEIRPEPISPDFDGRRWTAMYRATSSET